jgi:single-stranded-DNA-specific exonuclease
LEELGGHSQAAGLRIAAENLPVFREAFERAVRSSCPPEAFVPKRDIDAVLKFGDITDDLADQLQALAPWGAGNPEPLFMAREVSVVSSSRVGGCHRRMQLAQSAQAAARTCSAIQFNVDPGAAQLQHFAWIAFRLRWNHWNGKKTLQLVIEAVSPPQRRDGAAADALFP